MPIDISGFALPLQQERQSKGLQDLAESMRYKDQLKYRQQKDAEADEWKKLNLIQDLTDLSKHQTGSDVADAIGHKLTGEIAQKYTQQAGKMSPTELMGNIQKDMSGIIGGMDAAKNELALADEQLKLIKQQYPDLDIASLAKGYRAEILGRRLKATGFNNPLEVGLSDFDITNPETLSRYSRGARSLTESIITPKGTEKATVFKGIPDAYTKYETQIPFWKKPSYNPANLKSGFMAEQGEPSLQIKSTELPPEALPSSQGKPFKIIDEDVYEKFSQDPKMNVELISATREAYPNYDKFNPTEKNYAKRNVLYNKIKELDQTGFYPTEVRRAARNVTNVKVGGANSEVNVRDLYNSIKTKAASAKDGFGYPLNHLSTAEQGQVLKIARDVLADNDISQADIAVKYNDADKSVSIIRADGSFIAPLDFTGTNVPAQVSVKEKREVVAQGNSQSKGGEINLNDVPAGTKLEKKGNDYYYKGKKVKM